MAFGMKSRCFKSCMLAMSLAVMASGFGCHEDKTNSSSDIDVVPEKCGNLLYDTCRIAPSLKQVTGEDLMDFLGPVVVDGGVNFEVYSEHATRIEVLLFNDPEASQPSMRFPMYKNPQSDVWSVFVSGLGTGQYYGYIAWGPNWPYDPKFQPGTTTGFISDCDKEGNRFNPNKLLTDPYAKRQHRDFDWGKGSPASGEGAMGRQKSSWGGAAKSVVIESKYTWSENEAVWRANREKGDAHVGHSSSDAIYYEVHPKGMTKGALSTMKINDLTVNVSNQGTWRGIGEMAPYLKDLGITAIELLPVAEKPDDGGYWGYNTINFFAPEWKFTSKCQNTWGEPDWTRCTPNDVVDEFKWMVDQLHQNDVEVILDVVYNHTGEGGFWQSKVQGGNNYGGQQKLINPTAVTLFSFRGLDNSAYYFVGDYNGAPGTGYIDGTGVGNMTRANHKPFRRLIMDSLHYWVEEMHVDGFRFDLATVLGIPDDNVYAGSDEWRSRVGETVLQDLIDDKVMQKYNVRLIAEPWSVSAYVLGGFPKTRNEEKPGYAWSEWNDHFRDMLRQFVNYSNYPVNSNQDGITIGNLLLGTSERYGNRSPYNSVNFISVHDGFTINDVVSYQNAYNGCGKLNLECCTAYNDFCETQAGEHWNKSRAWCNYEPTETAGRCVENPGELNKRQMARNFFALMMFSQGSPLILGGDEWMRTQLGNSNAYTDMSDNEWNWYRWGDWLGHDELVRMYDFVKKIIKIRKEFSEFLSPKAFGAAVPRWDWPEGHFEDWGGEAVGMYYEHTETTPSLFIMINMNEGNGSTRIFPFPEEGEWEILVDTQQYFDNLDGYFKEHGDLSKTISQNVWLDGSHKTSGSYEVQWKSIVVAKKVN